MVSETFWIVIGIIVGLFFVLPALVVIIMCATSPQGKETEKHGYQTIKR